MSLQICHLLLTLKNYVRKRAQICDSCSLEYFAMLSRFHSRGRTHDAGSVTRIAFKYKLMGFCVCLLITVGQSTGQATLH